MLCNKVARLSSYQIKKRSCKENLYSVRTISVTALYDLRTLRHGDCTEMIRTGYGSSISLDKTGQKGKYFLHINRI